MRPYIPASQRVPMCITGCILLKDGLEGLEICDKCGEATKDDEGHFRRFFYHTPVRASIAAFLKDPIYSAKLEAGQVQNGDVLQDFWGKHF